MEENKLSINSLPSKTWNWLNVNESQLKLPETTVPCEIDFKQADEIKLLMPAESFNDIETGAGANILFDQKELPVYQIMSKEETNSGTVRLHIRKNGENDHACSAGNVTIWAEENSEITAIMDYTDTSDASFLLALRTRLRADKNSKIRLIQIQFMGENSTLLNDIGGICEENASIEVIQILLGKGNVYSASRIDLLGAESSFHTEIGYLGQNKQKLDFNLIANHIGERTQSYIRADGTLKDSAEKVFRGTIDFKTGSSGSEGEETENVLLLGDQIINKTIPLILCAEEDVKGNHGATIGELDSDMLFYFASRGMTAKEAEDIVTRGKLIRLCDSIKDEETENQVRDKISEVMDHDGSEMG